MAEAALNWRDLSVPQKIVKARSIIKAMTGNANFTIPNPSLATVATAINALESAANDVEQNGGGKKWTNIRGTAEKELDRLMSQLAKYIGNMANGDSAIILSAAIDLKKTPTRVGKLPAPQNVIARPADAEGSIKLTWKKVSKAASYKVMMSDDTTPKAWKEFANNTSTDSKLEITGLTSGAKMWFCIIAINSAGEGDMSDPATCRVP